MFTKKDHFEYKPTIPGVRMRPLVYENRTLMCEFLLEHGYELPIHSHPYEQSGYLVSGRLRFHIGDEWMDTRPGDSWCIPEDVLHEVIVIEDSHLIELFSPVRPDYLPENYGILS